MGVGDRPATCTSCGKRLSRKSWFYRNGKFFCKRRCWETEQAKAAAAATPAPAAPEAPAAPAAPPAAAS
jgi:hypothetical protein